MGDAHDHHRDTQRFGRRGDLGLRRAWVEGQTYVEYFEFGGASHPAVLAHGAWQPGHAATVGREAKHSV
jgi:hypothetical protein